MPSSRQGKGRQRSGRSDGCLSPRERLAGGAGGWRGGGGGLAAGVGSSGKMAMVIHPVRTCDGLRRKWMLPGSCQRRDDYYHEPRYARHPDGAPHLAVQGDVLYTGLAASRAGGDPTTPRWLRVARDLVRSLSLLEHPGTAE